MDDMNIPADSAWQNDDSVQGEHGGTLSFTINVTKRFDGYWYVTSPEFRSLFLGRRTRRRALLAVVDAIEEIEDE